MWRTYVRALGFCVNETRSEFTSLLVCLMIQMKRCSSHLAKLHNVEAFESCYKYGRQTLS